MKKRWTYKILKSRGGRKGIKLSFDGRQIAMFSWFPPWQNELMEDNAKYLARTLNAAFALGPNAAEKIESLRE